MECAFILIRKNYHKYYILDESERKLWQVRFINKPSLQIQVVYKDKK